MVKTNQGIVDFKVLLNSYSFVCRVICSGQIHKWYLVSCMLVDNIYIYIPRKLHYMTEVVHT